ncbi:hypothetical protein POM88_044238 [Heracleum sosnowskyi]|uniref:Uncharacterized protein n=1 Tax=Heracleum sosnowskyi TaxID=360622 RepID=A0AAD8M4Y8_9APIA|nr:hypothetical protein POM88_044238 [Heracleum sosnowskyi]
MLNRSYNLNKNYIDGELLETIATIRKNISNVGEGTSKKRKLSQAQNVGEGSSKKSADVSGKNDKKKMKKTVVARELLNFSLRELPNRLAFLLLQSLNEDELVLNLQCGLIKIEEVDVNMVLGLPMCGFPVELEGNGEIQTEKEKVFRQQFSSQRITSTLVAEKINKNGVDEHFKVNFLVVMGNTLLRTVSNGTIDQKIENKVRRTVPRFRSWSEQNLRLREAVEIKDDLFGKGRLREREEINDDENEAVESDDEKQVVLNLFLVC